MPSCYKKRGGVRGGATHIHKRKLSSEPHVKKGYKLGNHLFHTPVITFVIRTFRNKNTASTFDHKNFRQAYFTSLIPFTISTFFFKFYCTSTS